jgi:nicotinate-nucleotide--dimethylbenzimidazole phosphoribosyltransferase
MNRSLIVPTANPALEESLRDALLRRADLGGRFGELEPLALRLARIQNAAQPQFHAPQLLVFAADHGLAVDGIAAPQAPTTSALVQRLLDGRLPLSTLARQQGMAFTVVDAGLADRLPPHEHLLMRKIAHGTRNARVGAAMSIEQTHAAIRAGMEIGDSLPGNAVACAAIGVGSHESASLVLARLSDVPVRDFLYAGPGSRPDRLAHLMVVAQGAQGRHLEVTDPVEVLAAFGGFEIAMMAGVMLVAAGKRHLILVDGIAACAALRVAMHIAESVGDYCLFCRSHGHPGLDRALGLFQAAAMLELGLETVDGTGAALAWPLVRSAATLLEEPTEDRSPADPVATPATA